jgi:acetylornithine aminotransferase
MTRTDDLTALWNDVMMPNYGTPPIALERGEGVYVWDVEGNRYLDFIAGIATSSLGHGHPAIVEAVSTQVGRLAHSSNLVMHAPGLQLAQRLSELAGGDVRIFFSNDGSEANECAIKVARRWAQESASKPAGGGERTQIIAAEGGFHGRTLGSLSITGNPPKRLPFAPLVDDVVFVPYGDAEALNAAISDRTAAVFLEPTLGEGGVVPPPPGYLAAARATCDRVGALFVLDEVQSGIGRTGHWFAFQREGVQPDIVTLAKGLGGGMPIGACLAFGPVGSAFHPGDHGSTFGGNPVSASSALAVLTTLADQDLLASVAAVGDALAAALEPLAGEPGGLVAGVRGSGLWRALVLTGPHAPAVEAAARARGLLVNAVQPDTIRIAPPLILTADEALDGAAILAAAVADVAASLEPAGAGG